MGKASSSKKVARAARAGSTHRGPQRRALGFPLTIAVVVLLGTSLVVYSRDNRSEDVPPVIGDHWHAAYGIWNCDHWEGVLSDAGPDLTGIHTHADSIIHVHPFNSGSAGTRATMGKFFDTVAVESSDDKLTLPSGTVLDESAGCADQPAELVIARWPADQPDAEAEIINTDFDDIRFREDREVFTIALVREGETPPRPESVPTLDNLSDVIEAPTTTAPGATTTTTPGATTTTTPGAEPSATTTTTPGEPGATTTTGAPDATSAPTTTGG
ncbi:MAG TPA: hypothetical protein VF183_16855 [Acidimicrobiales bacterium]